MSDSQTLTNKNSLIDVSQSAADKLKIALEKAITDAQAPEDTQAAYGIRLSVMGGGCAGLQYDIKPVENSQPGDIIEEFFGIRFYIHPMVLPYLKGTRLDYSDSLMDGGFKFQNPNAASSCGCGTSFGI